MVTYAFTISQYGIILLSVLILIRCLRSMLKERIEPETWAYIRVGEDLVPITHWENIIGRGRSSDIRIFGGGIGRTHAVLNRNDKGKWSVFDVFSKSGVWVNGDRVPEYGSPVHAGDVISLGGSCVNFEDISAEERFEKENQRTSVGGLVSPAITLGELTLLQLFLLVQHYISADRKEILWIAVAFGTVIVLEWSLYNAMRLFNRSGFEIEILAFFLTSIGLSIAASKYPTEMDKQILLIVASVLLFLLCGWWMRGLKRTAALRVPVAIFALGLLALNVVTSDAVYGARNWLSFGGLSFQPSELVKCAYIYVGAATLETLYRRRNLYLFIAFSAVCVIALALIGDFGTALIFFVTFLVISFMRSGSIATVFLAVSGAVMAGFLAVTVKPYIARRFDIWRHVWEDVYDAGYQQTRAMSAAASGGLIGKGAGNGWLKNIFASETDMAFAMVCEEFGLIVAVCMVFSILLMAFFAVRSTRNGRSSYFGIASCATMSLLLAQLSLNVFGSLDILPFTGVTFPFVSRGGTSLLSCWMLMAFLKGADNRRDASFVVKPVRGTRRSPADVVEEEIAAEAEEPEGADDLPEFPDDWMTGGDLDETEILRNWESRCVDLPLEGPNEEDF